VRQLISKFGAFQSRDKWIERIQFLSRVDQQEFCLSVRTSVRPSVTLQVSSTVFSMVAPTF